MTFGGNGRCRSSRKRSCPSPKSPSCSGSRSRRPFTAPSAAGRARRPPLIASRVRLRRSPVGSFALFGLVRLGRFCCWGFRFGGDQALPLLVGESSLLLRQILPLDGHLDGGSLSDAGVAHLEADRFLDRLVHLAGALQGSALDREQPEPVLRSAA